MAKNKKSFILYCDIINTVEQLDDKQAGMLFKHVLGYVNDLNPQTEDIVTKIAFEPIKQQFKRDLEKYENVCNRNSKNGSMGGRPKKAKEPSGLIKNPKEPSGLIGLPKEPKKADNDNDNDNDINTNIDFDKLLSFIKDKTGRQFQIINKSVKDKYKARLKEGYTKENIINAIINASQDAYHKEQKFKYLTPDYFSRAKSLDLHSFKEIKKKIEHQENPYKGQF